MFFRLKHSPSGQCLQLIEAYRNQAGLPRQRIVVSLGDVRLPQEEQSLIARCIEAKLQGQNQLFPPSLSAPAQGWIDSILKRIEREGRWRAVRVAPAAIPSNQDPGQLEVLDGVLVDQVSHTHTTPLGPSLVGWNAWNRLGLPELLSDLGFNSSQAQAAAITVINRLASPGSEHALLDWLPDSSLPELMNLAVNPGIKDRFYRVSDQLLKNQAAIEKHLREQQGELFQVNRTILLYDLTNSYFEGEALGNPKAKRGQSKEKRHDCPQVVMGMVFDQRGCELVHQVFEGNQNDGKSLVAMIEALQQLVAAQPDLPAPSGSAKPLVIVDAGVATAENLRLLREKGFHYLVNDSRRGRSRYRKEFAQTDQFQAVGHRADKPPVQVRLLVDPKPPPCEKETPEGVDQPDQLILCRSQGREEKERAIRSQAESKYLEALQKLAQRVDKGKLKTPEKIQRAIGRLQQKHPRVQRFYRVELQAPALEGGRSTIRWSRQEDPYRQDEELLGCYVLRTDQGGGTAEHWWNLYTTLTKAEEGFRALKSDLGLRPNFHQREKRVDGHVLITVLAYHLLWFILQMLEAAGDHRCWQTIKRVLQTHAYTTLLLPTQGGELHRIRRAGEPEECQKEIYAKLKINWKNLPRTRVVVEKENAATL
jgi:transposase